MSENVGGCWFSVSLDLEKVGQMDRDSSIPFLAFAHPPTSNSVISPLKGSRGGLLAPRGDFSSQSWHILKVLGCISFGHSVLESPPV